MDVVGGETEHVLGLPLGFSGFDLIDPPIGAVGMGQPKPVVTGG